MKSQARDDAGKLAVQVLRNVPIEMRDGVVLRADLYTPAMAETSLRTNRWPCILERTPYGKLGTRASDYTAADVNPRSTPEIARWFASHGIAVLVQDCRGRYDSDGAFEKYVNESNDGVDTLRWILRQPWSDQRVITQGLSYCGHTQMALAVAGPRGLFAQFIDSGGLADAFYNGVRQGGAFELKQVTWAIRNASRGVVNAAKMEPIPDAAVRTWFRRMPWTIGKSPLSASPDYEKSAFTLWHNTKYSTYWKQPSLCCRRFYRTYADVPIVLMTGWYDPYVWSVLRNYEGLARPGRSRVCLVIGPWTHGQRSRTFAGMVDFGSSSTFDDLFGASYFDVRLQWYQYLLGQTKYDPFSRRRVCVFVMGGGTEERLPSGRVSHGGRWVFGEKWPLAGVKREKWFLGADRLLRRRVESKLPGVIEFVHSPWRPVLTNGGAVTSAEALMVGGAFNQRNRKYCVQIGIGARAPSARSTVISFRSRPLDRDVEVVGEPWADLFISCDQVDTDVVVRLIDEWEDGEEPGGTFAMNLCDGITRVRYRASFEEPELMTPGEVVAVRVLLGGVGNCFRRGHRIGIDVCGSNFPRFDVNPGNGDAWWEHASDARVARTRIYVGGARWSSINLPIRTRR